MKKRAGSAANHFELAGTVIASLAAKRESVGDWTASSYYLFIFFPSSITPNLQPTFANQLPLVFSLINSHRYPSVSSTRSVIVRSGTSVMDVATMFRSSWTIEAALVMASKAKNLRTNSNTRHYVPSDHARL
jgi:hypothetical protein